MCPLSDPDSDSCARAIAVRYLLSLKAERAEDRMAAAAVAEGIKHQYAQSSTLRRDFPNSQNHRYKTRLLQAFLVLLPLLDGVGDQSKRSSSYTWDRSLRILFDSMATFHPSLV